MSHSELQPVSTWVPDEVISHWSRFTDAKATLITGGLINFTLALKLTDGTQVIVQRLHPIFSTEVNKDLAAVSAHLISRGVCTPQLIPTDHGALWVEQNGIWRALTFLSGQTFHYLIHTQLAYEAGQLVGRFHTALADFHYEYQSGRGFSHDTAAHLTRLIVSLERHHDHRLYDTVAPISALLLREAEHLDLDLSHLPCRHAHGDLKISNLLFDHHEKGLALLDLDTLGDLPWPLEMGDALRSWCHPRREDEQPVKLELNLLENALRGYRHASGNLITCAEWQALIPGVARICLELAARFLCDALEERYFGWDAIRYSQRGEHNLARGQAMWLLYQDTQAQRLQAETLVAHCFNK